MFRVFWNFNVSIEVAKGKFLFLNWVSFNDPTRALNNNNKKKSQDKPTTKPQRS